MGKIKVLSVNSLTTCHICKTVLKELLRRLEKRFKAQINEFILC